MSTLSTARQSLARLDARIAAETDATRKGWLTIHRNHWWGQAIDDVDMLVDGPLEMA